MFLIIYLLVKLVLILPVTIATIERCFSAINFVKNEMRNDMEDERLDDLLVTFIKNKNKKSLNIF